MQQFKAFTLKFDKTSLDLKTQCGLSIAHNHKFGEKYPPIITFIGLWDTGATGTVISKNVVDALNLKPISKAKVFHADGESIVNVYAINVILPNQVGFKFVKATEGKLQGFDVLIGMNIITRGDFAITNVGGKTTFTFRCPSLKEIDYVQEAKENPLPAIQIPLTAKPPLRRNDPCHCGSGKKYKQCHGLNI